MPRVVTKARAVTIRSDMVFPFGITQQPRDPHHILTLNRRSDIDLKCNKHDRVHVPWTYARHLMRQVLENERDDCFRSFATDRWAPKIAPCPLLPESDAKSEPWHPSRGGMAAASPCDSPVMMVAQLYRACVGARPSGDRSRRSSPGSWRGARADRWPPASWPDRGKSCPIRRRAGWP
jgi:hypothetical protein